MTHVEIHTEADPEIVGRLRIEGFELTDHVSSRHLWIEYPEVGPPLVHVALVADRLDVTHGGESPSAVRVEVEGSVAGPWGAAVKAARESAGIHEEDLHPGFEDLIGRMRRDLDDLMIDFKHFRDTFAGSNKAKRRARR